jgi:hypothetical protein
MSILQISKIQQRSGDLVDLPQLDEAEFGFATDAKKLFIGKTSGESQNIEVLTAYSEIAFDQIDGAVGNLNIDGNTLANGQVLAFDGSNWVNKGGSAGGFIDLGNITDISISGGEIGYVMTTDSQGGLSWTPKGLIVLDIEDISASSEARMTLVNPYPLSSGVEITVQSILPGSGANTQYANTFNGEVFWLKSVPGNLQLYDIYEDAALTLPIDTTGFGTYPGNGIAIFNTTTANGGLVAGSEYSIQYNNGYDFAGDLGLTWNYTSNTLTVGNSNTGNISGHLVVTGTTNLNDVSNVTITGGQPFQFLKTDGNGELYWGNIREDAVGYYFHRQETANTTWLVVHNLNTQYVDVTPINGAGYSWTGRYDYPVITFINANALSMTFSSAESGYAVISGDSTNPESYFLYTQSGGSTTWTVNHNLDTRYVAVTPIDTSNVSIIGEYNNPTIEYNTANTLTLTFDTAVEGKVAVVGSNSMTGYYLHDQTIASNVWTVTHNLDTRYLSVTPIDAANLSYVGRYDYPEIFYVDTNTLTLTFPTAVTGKVVVIGSGGFDNPAGGLDTYVQYNDGGVLNGSPAFTFDNTSNIVTVQNLQTTVISTGANTTAGTITGNWSLTTGSRLTATYADLAEYYCADKSYEPGTVLEFGGEQEVTLAKEESNRIAGVVSTNPAYVMNATLECEENSLMIALIGRVPVKVKGAVSKGDMLVSAGQGYAKASIVTPKIGTVIGKAISSKNDDGEGIVEVLVGRL